MSSWQRYLGALCFGGAAGIATENYMVNVLVAIGVHALTYRRKSDG